jgi:tol-pal system protein YbgF
MKERILELQEQAAMADVELARLREEVAGLRRQLASGSVAVSDIEERPWAEPAEPQAIAEPVGNTAPMPVESSDLELEPRQEPPMAEAQMSAEGEPSAIPPSDTQPVEPAAQALYDRGYTLYHQGKYLDAEASFQRFLQAYPATELSDNAQFWIGESRYSRGDLRGALSAFQEVAQKYPEGNKVADSLIKEGDCLEQLGDREGARDRYGEVMRRFPDSGAAVMAEDRLAGLD